MSTENENRENLDQIQKALNLIDSAVFEIINSVEIKTAQEFIRGFRRDHEELKDRIFELAGLVKVDVGPYEEF
jgi:hypothetical protein